MNSKEFEDLIISLRELLKIDKSNLDVECQNQADLYSTASSAYAEAISIKDKLEEELKEVEAMLYTSIRSRLEQAGEKYSESKIDALIKNDTTRKNKLLAALIAREQASVLYGIVVAFSQRKDMLQDLCKLYISGYFGGIEVKSGKDADYERAKDAVSRQRKLKKEN